MKKAFEVSTSVYRLETFADLVDALNHGLKVYLLLCTEKTACRCVLVKNGVEVISHLGKHVQFFTADDFIEGATAAYAVEKDTVETTSEGTELLFALAADYENADKLKFIGDILN